MDNRPILPLPPKFKVYSQRFDDEAISKYATPVDKISEEDVVLVKMNTPFGPPRSSDMLDKKFHQGRLNFDSKEL